MPLELRLGLYEKIERIRERPLVVYITSSRPNAAGNMAADSIPELLDQLSTLPADAKAIDLLVVSQGGDPTVAWRMMCLLRERFSTIGVLVPQSAFSAATLLCLGADEIVMHQNGNLGPVDPQITSKRRTEKDRGEVRFGYEEVLAFISFIREQASITDQAQLTSIVSKLLDDVGCVSVGVAMRGSMLSLTLGENLLRMHMVGDGDGVKAKNIAEALNKKFFHHGHALGRTEALEIGLKITKPPSDLEQLMWAVWCDVESELQMREGFNPLTELASSPAHQLLFSPLTSISLPQGLSPQILQQINQQVLALAQPRVDSLPMLDCETVHAIMESTRLATRFSFHHRFSASRQHDGNIQISEMPIRQVWAKIEVPNTTQNSALNLPVKKDVVSIEGVNQDSTSESDREASVSVTNTPAKSLPKGPRTKRLKK